VALALLAGAPAAFADAPGYALYTIEVHGDGEQFFNKTGEQCFGQNWTHDMSATWSWKTTQQAEMISGELQLTGSPKHEVRLGGATESKRWPTCSTAGEQHRSCVGTSLMTPSAAIGTRIEPHVPTVAGQQVTISGWGQAFAKMDNCQGEDSSSVGSTLLLLAPKQAETVILPSEVGSTFERKVSGTLSGKDCPNHTPQTTSCKYTWSATVIFKRMLLPGGGGGQPKPPPSGGGPSHPGGPAGPVGPTGPGGGPGTTPSGPGPGPGGGPSQGGGGGGIQIGGGRFGPRRRDASVPVTCSAGCRISAEAIARQRRQQRAPKKKGGKKKRPRRARASAVRVLGRTAATLAAGRRTDVRVTFSAAEARQIRKAGGIVLELRVTPSDGGAPVRKDVVVRA
jgi:hypothetical protein